MAKRLSLCQNLQPADLWIAEAVKCEAIRIGNGIAVRGCGPPGTQSFKESRNDINLSLTTERRRNCVQFIALLQLLPILLTKTVESSRLY